MSRSATNRAEAPPNPNGGYIEMPIAKGSAGTETRWQKERNDPFFLHQRRYEDPPNSQPRKGYSGFTRFIAGEVYAGFVELSAPRVARDSTELERVSGSAYDGVSEAVVTARRKVSAIDCRLKAADRTIVRKLCVEGWSLSGAVREACGERYVHTVSDRVREALDALIDAMDGAQKSGYTTLLTAL